KDNERYYGLLHVDAVNGDDPETAKERVHFPALTALYPDRFMQLEKSQKNLSTRIIDLMTPIGFGQRGLIVAPPKAGKTMLLKDNERYYGLLHVDAVNGDDPETAKERVHFPALTALYPDRFMQLEKSQKNLSTRIIDLMTPIGFGQRGLIVAPPKAGKTMLL